MVFRWCWAGMGRDNHVNYWMVQGFSGTMWPSTGSPACINMYTLTKEELEMNNNWLFHFKYFFLPGSCFMTYHVCLFPKTGNSWRSYNFRNDKDRKDEYELKVTLLFFLYTFRYFAQLDRITLLWYLFFKIIYSAKRVFSSLFVTLLVFRYGILSLEWFAKEKHFPLPPQLTVKLFFVGLLSSNVY